MLDFPAIEPDFILQDHVAPDALRGIRRQQTNPKRWGGAGWAEFTASLRAAGIEVIEQRSVGGTFATDAGGTAYGMPHGVVVARSAAQITNLAQGGAGPPCARVTRL